MKVQPIPEELWKAMNIICHEVNDVIDAVKLIEDTLSDEEKEEFQRLQDANDLVGEYASCHNALGEVSQQGRKPHCWNEDTIFTPYEDTKDYNDNEEYIEGVEDTGSAGNQTVSEDAE